MGADDTNLDIRMLTKKIEDRLWSALVFIPAGIVCLGYVLWKRDFAKLHIEFSFLSFPVFVGEILLFFCVSVLIARWLSRRPALNRAYFFIALYLAWLAIKTVSGYWAWGPLAFRHAAFFYYPLFFLIGYVFFNRDLFTRWTIPLLLAVIAGLLLYRRYDRYWTFTLASLGLVLVFGTKEKKQRVVMLGVLLLSIPYLFLIKTVRMMFLANTASLVFLIACLWYLLEKKLYIKLAVLTVFVIVLGGGFYKFFILGESGRVFVPPAKVMEVFREMDEDVQQKKIHYQPEPLHVGLYNSPNFENRDYHYCNRNARPSEPEIVVQKNHAAAFASGERPEITPVESVSHSPKPEIVPEENHVTPPDASAVTVVQERVAAFTSEERPGVPLMKWVSGKEESLRVEERPGIEESRLGQATGITGVAGGTAAAIDVEPVMPVEWLSVNNIVFRLFIWRDMWDDWKGQHSPLFGVDFGKPLRSVSLEILRWAEWEWRKDGWIEPHNSFFHMLYRAGIVGVVLVALIFWSLAHLIIFALRKRSWSLILLSAVLLNWMVAANFLLIFELPYTAIPFWLLAGMAWAYAFGNDSGTRLE